LSSWYDLLTPHSIYHIPLSRLFPFFFNAPAPTEIYTLSLHDALPISSGSRTRRGPRVRSRWGFRERSAGRRRRTGPRGRSPLQRSEEHTSELQSLTNLVCRLLLEKKKNKDCIIVPTRRATD